MIVMNINKLLISFLDIWLCSSPSFSPSSISFPSNTLLRGYISVHQIILIADVWARQHHKMNDWVETCDYDWETAAATGTDWWSTASQFTIYKFYARFFFMYSHMTGWLDTRVLMILSFNSLLSIITHKTIHNILYIWICKLYMICGNKKKTAYNTKT